VISTAKPSPKAMPSLVKTKMKQIKLEEIDRQLPFEVPDRYFDKLSSVIQNRVTAKPEPIFTVSWSWKRTVLLVASSVMISVLVWVTYPSKQRSIGEEALSQVNEDAIVTYLKNGDVIASDLINENNLSNTSDSTIINHLDISEQDIIKHLDGDLSEI
jgi:hypothetical protein